MNMGAPAYSLATITRCDARLRCRLLAKSVEVQEVLLLPADFTGHDKRTGIAFGAVPGRYQAAVRMS